METLTFYSYKGGTGRSLLLANAARYLAFLGKRVVAVDFDIEAPGLHYKLNIGAPGVRTADVVPERGLVDYLLAATEGKPPPGVLDFLVPVPLPSGCTGELHLMPAGAAPSGEYWKKLTALLRHDVFSDPEGGALAAYLELKARIEQELKTDFLLIDSRTGITELAGVATALLADKVVCLVLNNRESLTGARAVMRSLRRAVRLPGQEPIEIVAVLSRVPERDEATVRQVRAFLNEPAPSPEETLALERIFVLRVDPELGLLEKLYVGSGEPTDSSPLYQDYLALFVTLVSADPKVTAALRRQEAIQETRDWLAYRPDPRRSDEVPEGFRAEQIDEGVRFGTGETRYADLVVYSGEDRSEALIAVEYVEDLESEDWRWWDTNTRLRCVILVGQREGEPPRRRIFTRGRRGGFTERSGPMGWSVKSPLSFSALADPGDRSVTAMLEAVRQGEDGYINSLIREWQRASFATLHGGGSFRPALAREILDGLADVRRIETELWILWRTAPDPQERSDKELAPQIVEMTTRELHAPLWWRLSVAAKIDYLQSTREASTAGLDLLARELVGLSLDEDSEFRRQVAPLIDSLKEDEKASGRGAYRFTELFRQRELKYLLSEEPPVELIRRVAIRQRIAGSSEIFRPGPPWQRAEEEAREVLNVDQALSELLRESDGRPSIITTNLLGSYDPETAQVTLYRRLIDWCARTAGIDARALANVVYLHETVHAVCHLGRDLDGRAWDDFALPSWRDPAFRPSALHEGLAQYFSFRLIERLGDAAMMAAFERLSDFQPPEYTAWRKMRDVPIEVVRRVLVRARAGLDDTSW